MKSIWRLCALLVLSWGFFVGHSRGASQEGFVLEISMTASENCTAQLFYDIGQWYSGVDSVRVPIDRSTTLRPYRFPIPAEPIKHLRFDPADGKAHLKIGQLRLLTSAGVELVRFGPESLISMHSIESLEISHGVATVVTGEDDPMLSITKPLQAVTEVALGRHVITTAQIVALAALLLALCVLAVIAAVRSLRVPRSLFLASGGIFLIVLGARLYWLLHYSRPMPYWDEWETDAIDLLIPWRGGYLDWQALFIPQGEHRIFFTRVLNLISTVCNGEWDPRLGMVIGAALFALSLALVFAAAAAKGKVGRIAIAVALVSWAGLPFDYRNLFWGDQTQMYALNVFAVVTIAIAVAGSIDGWLIAGAAAAASVSLFTMGNGMLAPAIGAVICLGRLRNEPPVRRRLIILSVIFGCATIAGLLLYRDAPFQGSGYTKRFADFWPAFVSKSSWPFSPRVLGMAVVWLPWVGQTLCLALKGKGSKLDWFAWGIGCWGLLNAVGLAHGRPLDLAPFDPKYYTSMSLAVVGSILCAAALTERWGIKKSFVAVALAAASVAALVPIAYHNIAGAEWQYGNLVANDNIVRPFLASGDPTQMAATPYTQLPYWNGAELAGILDSKDLQPVLPAVLRSAAALRPNGVIHGPQSPGTLTLFARSLMKLGLYLAAAGLVLFGYSLFERKREPIAPS